MYYAVGGPSTPLQRDPKGSPGIREASRLTWSFEKSTLISLLVVVSVDLQGVSHEELGASTGTTGTRGGTDMLDGGHSSIRLGSDMTEPRVRLR